MEIINVETAEMQCQPPQAQSALPSKSHKLKHAITFLRVVSVGSNKDRCMAHRLVTLKGNESDVCL
jgi:hypothetical protein